MVSVAESEEEEAEEEEQVVVVVSERDIWSALVRAAFSRAETSLIQGESARRAHRSSTEQFSAMRIAVGSSSEAVSEWIESKWSRWKLLKAAGDGQSRVRHRHSMTILN